MKAGPAGNRNTSAKRIRWHLLMQGLSRPPEIDPKPSVATGGLREAQLPAIVAAAIASRLSHSIRFASASAEPAISHSVSNKTR